MINILDQSTINKIAAGEVVERPMSIVKELVENSIDADASQITVEIKDGGLSYIRVTDNGNGIEKDDIRRAYMRHATSKLSTAEDLVGVMTLGFRGEALSTIAAVTETEMVTKTRDSLTGIKYVINGGREESFGEVGAPDGTTIISRNIFFNTPARLKFLKTAMTEGSYINDLIVRIALSHPTISFKLIANGKVTISTSGNGKLKDVIYAVYGRDITANLLPVDYSENGISVSGYIAKPFISKGNRSFENYFVNGRYITNPIIAKAIEEAYKTSIMMHKFPFTMLSLKLDPKMCDVNIHPTKKEFKYYNEKALFHTVYHAVSDALIGKEIIPDFNLDKKNAEDQKAAAEGTDNVKKAETSINNNVNLKQTEVDAASKQSDVSAAVKNDSGSSLHNKTESFSVKRPEAKPAAQRSSYSILEKLLPPEYLSEVNEKKAFNFANKKETVEASSEETIKTQAEKTEKIVEDIRKETAAEKEVRETQRSLFEDDYISSEAISHHRILGLAFDTYWISQYNDALYLMDQHAAHEKVNYEHFMKAFKERTVVSQRVFPPEVISLSALEMNAVVENLEFFRKCGFEIDEFGGNEVRISALPISYIDFSGREVFLEFASYLAQNITGINEDIFVTRLATMGCKAAVKGNQRISIDEAQRLIEDLLTLDNPYTCPHGRPTIIKLTRQELDKKFKRIV